MFQVYNGAIVFKRGGYKKFQNHNFLILDFFYFGPFRKVDVRHQAILKSTGTFKNLGQETCPFLIDRLR